MPAGDLREALGGQRHRGWRRAPQALIEAAHRPADWVMSRDRGRGGACAGVCRRCRKGATLALANKELLVTAGPLLLGEARAHGATILPVDSEHSAIFQGLVGEDMAAVERDHHHRLGRGVSRLADGETGHLPRSREASSHPNWDMGQRITIDFCVDV